ncbi:hypothetical protein [Magnetofaba australis]|nr:hypothetical protein [Magnetofaba australis]
MSLDNLQKGLKGGLKAAKPYQKKRQGSSLSNQRVAPRAESKVRRIARDHASATARKTGPASANRLVDPSWQGGGDAPSWIMAALSGGAMVVVGTYLAARNGLHAAWSVLFAQSQPAEADYEEVEWSDDELAAWDDGDDYDPVLPDGLGDEPDDEEIELDSEALALQESIENAKIVSLGEEEQDLPEEELVDQAAALQRLAEEGVINKKNE